MRKIVGAGSLFILAAMIGDPWIGCAVLMMLPSIIFTPARFT